MAEQQQKRGPGRPRKSEPVMLQKEPEVQTKADEVSSEPEKGKGDPQAPFCSVCGARHEGTKHRS
jgi:hypothetical protein